MAKREVAVVDAADEEGSRTKRRRFDVVDRRAREEPAQVEEIHSARQLQSLLRFQQDQDLRSGIQSFKVFLDSILYPEDPESVGTKRAILDEFLGLQKSRIGDLQHSFLEDVMQTWSFASQSNIENLVSSVSAVLALLLKVISTRLELRQHGFNLCKTLLRIPQLKLIRRSLGAPKHKPFIISPVLRLLTEIVSFDGGTHAKELYTHREYTFEPQIVAHHVSGKGDVQSQDPSKPSVRSNAIRYVLANFKYQQEGAKIDIIRQANINRALFAHIDHDAPVLVKEILEVLYAHVISDDEIPRGNKTFLLDDRNLNSILGACRRRDEDQLPVSGESSVPVQQEALRFLRLVCTTPNLGVLIPCRGWYSTSSDDEQPSDGLVSLAGEGTAVDDVAVKITVRNTILASFIHVLRPFASEMEMDLLVDIFRAAPELIADYFAKKTAFPFDPNLTATWIGYAAFLFSIVSLPPPSIPDQQLLPPPVSIVIESVLPRPLGQQVLTKCLKHGSDLVRIFGTQLLIVAIQKLRSIVSTWREREMTSWTAGASRLELAVGQRYPSMTDVVALMRQSTKKQMQYEASARLLRLYYEDLPWLALREKLDISTSVSLELQALEDPSGPTDEARQIKLLTLSHLLAIAQLASGMQWWKKPEKLRYSPFTTLLALAAASPEFRSQNSQLLVSLAGETGTDSRALEILLETLRLVAEGREAVLSFLDECFLRLMRVPIKYADMLEATAREATSVSYVDNSLPALLMTVEEQMPFADRTGNTASILLWASSYLSALSNVNEYVAAHVKTRLLRTLNEDLRYIFEQAPKARIHVNGIVKQGKEATALPNGKRIGSGLQEILVELSEKHRPPKGSTKLAALQRWLQDDVLEVLETGLAAPLLLLCASDDSIRRQATLSLNRFIARLAPSDNEQLQHYLLLSQLRETMVLAQDDDESEAHRPPYLLMTFTLSAAAILSDPTHILYSKLNTFMNEGASWAMTRLPSYWMKVIIDSPPEDDSGNNAWDELEWLLQWLYDGLRTADDMNILRKCRVFEKMVALYNDAPRSTRTKILNLIMRAIEVPGGSTTLITRFATLDWLTAQATKQRNSHDKDLMLATRSWLWQTCDQERVKRWSQGEIERRMKTWST